MLADAQRRGRPPLRAGLLGPAPPPEGGGDRPGAQPAGRARARLWADAVAFARAVGYLNAGTVEFLVDESGRYVFIEMNPRIQVEHTVTEEVTAIDLVQAQLQIAAGATLADLGISQGDIVMTGAALQCRITTEDPSQGFRPDTGRITAYRSPGGHGVRLDGCAYLGADVSPHFDSLLVKLTCRGRTFSEAVARARRAVAEFRVRGVATNIPFLQALLAEPDFIAGNLTTAFIEERPGLLNRGSGADRGTRLLNYMADVTVNRPNGRGPVGPGARRRNCPPTSSPWPRAGASRGRPARSPTAAARCSSASVPTVSPVGCASWARWRSRTLRCATPTSRSWPPGCGPRTCSRRHRTSPACCPGCCPSRLGAGRLST